MSINFQQPLKLQLKIQNYLWGKIGSKSLVARLLGENIKEEIPYAELWIGAHPNGCAEVSIFEENKAELTQQPLSITLKQFPVEILGKKIIEKLGNDLPFLLKVLSVGKALSIQAHPDKNLANQLIKRDAAHYPDNNHKPELAIAITELSLLYGFRPALEIKNVIEQSLEIQELLGQDLVSKALDDKNQENFTAILCDIYSTLVSPLKRSQLAIATLKLINRLRTTSLPDENEALVLKLYDDYQDKTLANHDIGIITSLLMNFIKIQPGAAIYVPPNTLHAHLYGDMLECMANSDNVVRAGLTEKFQDVSTLVEMLNYTPQLPTLIHSIPYEADSNVKRFPTPASEFAIDLFNPGPISAKYSNNQSIALLFCLEGKALVNAGEINIELVAGQACIIPAAASKYSVSYQNAKVFRVIVPE